MRASDIPTKFSVPFAQDAGGDSRPIPVTSSDPAAASQELGFPPETFVPVGAGGSPPDGRDMNGILNMSTAWDQWFSVGGPVTYDSAIQATVGGYPKGAIVQSATTFGLFWLCTADNNTTNPDASGAGWTLFPTVIPSGGGYLKLNSTAQLQVIPKDGGLLWINGVNYSIPAALYLSNSGLSVNTFYYVYAYMSGVTMTLEASTTGYTLAANGMPQKVGDATRTLVGAAYINASGNFLDSDNTRYVLSWFNRKNKISQALYNSPATWGSSTTEIAAGLRAYFISWADEQVWCAAIGSVYNGTSTGGSTMRYALNGTVSTFGNSSAVNNITGGAGGQAYALQGSPGVSEGAVNYVTVVALTNPGQTGANNSSQNQAMIRG